MQDYTASNDSPGIALAIEKFPLCLMLLWHGSLFGCQHGIQLGTWWAGGGGARAAPGAALGRCCVCATWAVTVGCWCASTIQLSPTLPPLVNSEWLLPETATETGHAGAQGVQEEDWAVGFAQHRGEEDDGTRVLMWMAATLEECREVWVTGETWSPSTEKRLTPNLN